jgi:hypothetical protein
MPNDSRWADINKQGSGSRPSSTDTPVDRDTQDAIDRANNASKLHQEANRLAEKGHE